MANEIAPMISKGVLDKHDSNTDSCLQNCRQLCLSSSIKNSKPGGWPEELKHAWANATLDEIQAALAEQGLKVHDLTVCKEGNRVVEWVEEKNEDMDLRRKFDGIGRDIDRLTRQIRGMEREMIEFRESIRSMAVIVEMMTIFGILWVVAENIWQVIIK